VEIMLEMSEFSIRDKSDGPHYIGNLVPSLPLVHFGSSGRTTVTYSIDLDHYLLSQIEKIREGKDVQFSARIMFVVRAELPEKVTEPYTYDMRDIRIAKSDWAEIILSQMKFKEVILFEFPKLEDGNFSNVISCINRAWKQYLDGEYSNVLTECRKALEAFKSVASDRGLIDGNAEVDWEKIAQNKEIGDLMSEFYRKLWRFVQHGAHIGKAINREDADFSLISTYALINFALKKLNLSP
jgi:hypothetical protein